MVEEKREYLNIDDKTYEIKTMEPKKTYRKMPSGYGIVQTEIMKLDISIQAKAIYCLLSSYTGSKDYCFPSIKTIASDLRISDKLVYKYLKELKEKKLIIVSKLFSDNRNNHKYEICYIDTPQNINFERVENINVGHAQNIPFINNNNLNNNNLNNNINDSISNEEQKKEEKNQENFEDIWRLYPIKCPIRKANIRVKRADCYKSYKQLLSLKWEDAEVFRSVQGYVKECENTKSYMKQLPSLLSEFKRNKPEDYMD